MDFCAFPRSRGSPTSLRGKTNSRGFDFCQAFAIVQTHPRAGFSTRFGLFFVSASSPVVDVTSLSFSLPFLAFSSSAGVLRFHVSGFPKRNVSERFVLFFPRTLSRRNCFGLTDVMLASRLQRRRTRCPISILIPGISLTIISLHGCLRDREHDWASRRHWFRCVSNVL